MHAAPSLDSWPFLATRTTSTSMPTPLASFGPLVHPHQLEVQEFDSYGLVVDARSRAEYDEDHIPGAVHLPVDETASDALKEHVQRLNPGETVLVYCSRGGLDSQVWAEPLRQLGFTVDVLGGGWPNYRRWVDAGLESLARSLTFKRLQGPPLGGVDQVMTAFEALGKQVLRLSELAGQRGVPGLPWPGDVTPSQPAFESLLLNAMRCFDSGVEIWVGDCLLSLGGLVLPAPMRDALQRAGGVAVSTPLAERVRLFQATVQGSPTQTVMDGFSALKPKPSKAMMSLYRKLIAANQLGAALAAVIENHIDLSYAPMSTLAPVGLLRLDACDAATVSIAADDWLASNDQPSLAAGTQIKP